MTKGKGGRVIEGVLRKAGREQTFKIEEYVKLQLQPKPWWLPQFLWYCLLKRLLILEMWRKA